MKLSVCFLLLCLAAFNVAAQVTESAKLSYYYDDIDALPPQDQHRPEPQDGDEPQGPPQDGDESSERPQGPPRGNGQHQGPPEEPQEGDEPQGPPQDSDESNERPRGNGQQQGPPEDGEEPEVPQDGETSGVRPPRRNRSEQETLEVEPLVYQPL